jgi:hypothetical protein
MVFETHSADFVLRIAACEASVTPYADSLSMVNVNGYVIAFAKRVPVGHIHFHGKAR